MIHSKPPIHHLSPPNTHIISGFSLHVVYLSSWTVFCLSISHLFPNWWGCFMLPSAFPSAGGKTYFLVVGYTCLGFSCSVQNHLSCEKCCRTTPSQNGTVSSTTWFCWWFTSVHFKSHLGSAKNARLLRFLAGFGFLLPLLLLPRRCSTLLLLSLL